MLSSNHFFSLFIFFLSFSTAYSQDVISVDGHNMGPRSFFIQACAGDSVVDLNPYQGYSSIAFCNCMADDMLPILTKKEMNYYFTQNNHTEIYKDTALSKIAMLCMVEAKKNWKPLPPPQEEILVEHSSRELIEQSSEELIDAIVELVNYEILFDEILEKRLEQLENEKKISEKQLEFLRDNVLFEEMKMTVIKNAYMDYSTEELSIIYEYLSGMSTEELNNSTVKYEQDMTDYFNLKIDLLIEEKLK